MVQLEGLDKFKYPITSQGVEPATFWLAHTMVMVNMETKLSHVKIFYQASESFLHREEYYNTELMFATSSQADKIDPQLQNVIFNRRLFRNNTHAGLLNKC
jgi:hypothetical protein